MTRRCRIRIDDDDEYDGELKNIISTILDKYSLWDSVAMMERKRSRKR